ncbi:hypothetical protein, partial [Streptomyces rochei]|uniref:hypothetical protein n=1 Tax=Streptomyces rochei TaxID=1928 RepID=UPI003432E630
RRKAEKEGKGGPFEKAVDVAVRDRVLEAGVFCRTGRVRVFARPKDGTPPGRAATVPVSTISPP